MNTSNLEKIKEIMKQSLEEVDEIGIKAHELYSISWLDDYNGKEPATFIVYGYEIKDNELRELLEEAAKVVLKAEATQQA